MDSIKGQSYPNPREKASALSVLLWWWTKDIFRKGYTNILTVDDLYDPLKCDKSNILGDRLEKQWEKELKRVAKSNRQPSLLKTIFYTFAKEIFLTGILYAILEFIVRLSTPILLGQLLQYFNPSTLLTYEDALLYAGGLTAANLITVFLSIHLTQQNFYVGGRIRIAVCSLVYRKALRLSKTALGETAAGKIVNLVATDVNRFELVMMFLHSIWSAPISTLAIGYILYTQAHFAALIGIAMLLAEVPILVYTSKLSSKYRLQTAIKTDERVRLMDEIVSGVQVIKMYAWEKRFCALVKLARRLELNVIAKTSFLRGVFMTFFLFSARFALYCTIVSMLMFGNCISTDKIFVFVSFFNLLSNSMTNMFVRSFTEFAECRVSIGRIQSFLVLDEFRDSNVTLVGAAKMQSLVIKEMKVSMMLKKGNNKVEKDSVNEIEEVDNNVNHMITEQCPVVLDHVTAKWDPSLAENTLMDIDLKLEKGKLYMVIGTVGSGKSSLLSSILGEINLVAGEIRVNGSISYGCQDAWVFGATVRQNILFGQPFDRERYEEVVKVCSLFKDFAQFTEGDHTVVGERGNSLSGGQKARISLARAVYRQADIYLLDDPLSAVDAHVGKYLFEECIRHYLGGKTRILATHQLQFIKDVDGIMLLDQGKMQYYKNYHSLLEAHPEYNSLLAADETHNSMENVSDENTEIRRRFSSNRSKSRTSESGDIAIENDKEGSRNLKDIIEATSKGVVKGSVFLKYLRMGSTGCTALIMAVLFILTQICVSLNDVFMPFIVTTEESRYYYEHSRNDTALNNITVPYAEDSLYPVEIYIYVFTAIVLSIFIVGITRTLVYYKVCKRSSERIHNSAFEALIRANMRFFDTNPSGRILNRFSKDTSSMDDLLPKAIMDSGQILLLIAGALIVTCTVNPIFLVPAVIIGAVCMLIRKMNLRISKNIKRLEGMTRSPVFTHLNATLNGISTIRAYQAQTVLKDEFDKVQDVHTSSWFLFTSTNFAYACALNFLTFCFITFITFSFLIFKDEFSSDVVGLALTQVMAITELVQWVMFQTTEVANQMMSVERILEYKQIQPETNLCDKYALKSKQKLQEATVLVKPPNDWPKKGTVEFKSVYMSYMPDSKPVIRDLSFLVKPMEKVGIVGRTGAGKSSLIAALFRLAHLDGAIEIDGIDTGSIALEDLRSRISIIPQDPVLFSGTLRHNLDPFNEFPDNLLWNVLEEVELCDTITTSGSVLDCRVFDRGSNFSVGQRQLVCLARAVLRSNRVLVLDEATANVDPQTDALIQRTIRTKFAACTVFAVAHRLNTIIDSDKVIVMDRGQLVEFDHPYVLLQKENGQFMSLVKETGDAMFDQLFNIAKRCYEKKCNENR